MGQNTSNHSLYQPDTGETGWGDEVNQNFADLDTKLVLKDTSGNRPAAGEAGRWYLETDTLDLYYDDGTAWQPVSTASGRGDYAAIVYTDGSTIYAEDAIGSEITSGTDATTVIQAAIDDAVGGLTDSDKEHRPVVVKGRYSISGTIYLKSWLELNLEHAVLTMANSAGVDMFQLNSTDTEQVKVVGGELRGNKANNTAGSAFSLANNGTGYSFNDPYHQIRNVYIMNFADAGVEFTDWSLETRLQNVMVEAVDGIGIDCSGSPDIKVNNCSVGYSGLEGYVSGDETIFNGCAAWFAGQQDSTRGDGFYLSAPEATATGCRSEDNQRHGIHADNWRSTITGCRALNNNQGATGGNGITVTGEDTVVSGCLAYDDQGTSTQDVGIYFGTAANNVIVGNYASGNTGAQIDGTGDSMVAGNFGDRQLVTVSSNHSISWATPQVIADSSGGTLTVTLPDPTVMVDVPVTVKHTGANSVTISRNGTENIDGAASDITLSTDNAARTLVSDGTDWWITASV